MIQKKYKIAFLGVGNMGGALIEGALNSGIVKPNQVTAYDLQKKRLKSIAKKYHIKTAASNRDAVEKSDFIFLCVKPQQMKELLLEIRQKLTPKQCLISIAAGISTRSIENRFSKSVPVIRVMPNTPALVQSGVTAIAQGKSATSRHIRFAEHFFSSVGKVALLGEKKFDAVTAISGSGPAYFFYLAESLEQAGQRLGLSKPVAELLSKQTFFGSAKMAARGFDPRRANSFSLQELRQRVTSPGGTTESAIDYLKNKKWADIFVRAIGKARDKSKELSLSYY